MVSMNDHEKKKNVKTPIMLPGGFRYPSTHHTCSMHLVYKTSAAAAASKTPALPATLAAALVNWGGADSDAEVGTIGTPVVAVEVDMTVVVLCMLEPDGCAKPELAVVGGME